MVCLKDSSLDLLTFDYLYENGGIESRASKHAQARDQDHK